MSKLMEFCLRWMSWHINITVSVLCRIRKENWLCFQFAEITIVTVIHGRGQDIAAVTQVTCFDTAGRAVVFVSMGSLIPAMHLKKLFVLYQSSQPHPLPHGFCEVFGDKNLLSKLSRYHSRYLSSQIMPSFPVLTAYSLFKIGSNLICKDSNRNCSSWKRRGECRRNPAYMLVNCKRSCGRC